MKFELSADKQAAGDDKAYTSKQVLEDTVEEMKHLRLTKQ